MQSAYFYNPGGEANNCAEMREASDAALESRAKARADLEAFLEHTPNLNAQHVTQINQIQEEFAHDALPISPITVLDAAAFDVACEIAQQPVESLGGVHIFGQTLIRSSSESRALYGPAHVLSIGLHESGHATAGEKEPLAIVRKAPVHVAGLAMREMLFTLNAERGNDFIRYRWAPNDGGAPWRIDGQLFEEGFADLKRVEGFRRLGLEATSISEPLGSVWPGGTSVNYVTPDDTLPILGPNGEINLPVGYASCVVATESGLNLLPSVPNIAAYVLTLLDREAPGLFEQIKAARRNPILQREIIRMVNGVEPGLYEVLRDLPYTEEGFVKGLHQVATTLSDKKNGALQVT